MNICTLNKLEDNRDNNFHLFRLVAAIAVIYSHSLALSGRKEFITPSNTLGLIAVKIFFVISGFLVVRSWLNRDNLLEFLAARCARIFPALWTTVIMCVLIGLAVTRFPMHEYLNHPYTKSYILKNIFPISGMQAELPNVFRSNPYRYGINGSLWTLQYELILYLLVALIGTLGFLKNKGLALIVLTLIVFSTFFFQTVGFAAFSKLLESSGLSARIWLEFSLYFSLGGSCAVFSSHIPIHWILTSLSAAAGIFLLSIPGADMWTVPVLTYAVISLAFLPFRWVTKFNRTGDYSYGLYVYAFPIQQLVMYTYLGNQETVKKGGPVWDIWSYFLTSLGATFLVSFLSWHIIEKPIIKFNSKFWKKFTPRPIE